MAHVPTVATAEHSFVENEHRELGWGIDQIHRVAARVGSISTHELTYELLHVIRWVETVLEPHAAWEDAVLYGEMDDRAGTPWATKLMRYEHQQIRRMARSLNADRDILRQETTHEELVEVRARLFGLEALIRAHMEREKLFLIPLLDE